MQQSKADLGVELEPKAPSKDEMLLALRAVQEKRHFNKVFDACAFGPRMICCPDHKPIDLDNVSGLLIHDAIAACHRTAPLFLVEDEFQDNWFVPYLFLAELFRYTYKRWFVPYQSNIDRGQFLTKVCVLPHTPVPKQPCSQEMVDYIKVRSANFCDRVEDTKSRILDWDEEQAGKRLYFMRPAFRAVAVAVRSSGYSLDVHDVSSVPVLIVRTGVEEGLSAPIALDQISASKIVDTVVDAEGYISAVQTTLDEAITFLMALEKREAEAATPDPLDTPWHMIDGVVDRAAEEASHLGWETDRMGPLMGPSSHWVDAGQNDWSRSGGYNLLNGHHRMVCETYRRNAEKIAQKRLRRLVN